jgi:predicted DNA-binding ribbon-helix-helix protein
MEDEFWEQLRIIAVTRNTAISQLLAEIERTGRLLFDPGPGRHRVRSLSAAVRVFVLQEVLTSRMQEAPISQSANAVRGARVRSPRSPWSLPPRNALQPPQ